MCYDRRGWSPPQIDVSCLSREAIFQDNIDIRRTIIIIILPVRIKSYIKGYPSFWIACLIDKVLFVIEHVQPSIMKSLYIPEGGLAPGNGDCIHPRVRTIPREFEVFSEVIPGKVKCLPLKGNTFCQISIRFILQAEAFRRFGYPYYIGITIGRVILRVDIFLSC